MLIVDANIVLRYLLLDNEELAEKASQIIENNKVFIHKQIYTKRKGKEQKTS